MFDIYNITDFKILDSIIQFYKNFFACFSKSRCDLYFYNDIISVYNEVNWIVQSMELFIPRKVTKHLHDSSSQSAEIRIKAESSAEEAQVFQNQ